MKKPKSGEKDLRNLMYCRPCRYLWLSKSKEQLVNCPKCHLKKPRVERAIGEKMEKKFARFSKELKEEIKKAEKKERIMKKPVRARANTNAKTTNTHRGGS